MSANDELYFAILDGDRKTAVEFTKNALANGADAQGLVDDDMIPAMNNVGQKFEDEDYFVPELLLSANAKKGALDLIRPILAESDAETLGRVLIGTVKGDLHDIGKNIVTALLEGAGFEIIDLGVDVAPGKLADAIKESKPDVVGLSALLTVTKPLMKLTIDFEEAGIRDDVKNHGRRRADFAIFRRRDRSGRIRRKRRCRGPACPESCGSDGEAARERPVAWPQRIGPDFRGKVAGSPLDRDLPNLYTRRCGRPSNFGVGSATCAPSVSAGDAQ